MDNTEVNWRPLKLFENRSDVMRGRRFGGEAGSQVHYKKINPLRNSV